jgi:hypothetical protein
VSDVERVADAMRKADAELEVQPPDLTQTTDHARRSLIRRLLLAGTLSAIGATLLLTGGLTPAAIKHSEGKHHNTASEKKQERKHKHDEEPDKPHHHHHRREEKEKERKDVEKRRAAVGPGVPIAVQLPDLIVSEISKTVLVVENISPANASSFVVLVTIEAEGQEPTELEFPFEAGLTGEQKAVVKLELECESGRIGAEVDPENEIEEASEENNVWTGTPPAECEPPDKGKTKEEEERAKAKETTGTVDSATNAVGVAAEP